MTSQVVEKPWGPWQWGWGQPRDWKRQGVDGKLTVFPEPRGWASWRELAGQRTYPADPEPRRPLGVNPGSCKLHLLLDDIPSLDPLSTMPPPPRLHLPGSQESKEPGEYSVQRRAGNRPGTPSPSPAPLAVSISPLGTLTARQTESYCNTHRIA